MGISLTKINITWRMVIGFSLVLLITVAVAVVGIINVNKVADNIVGFYDHPFTVVDKMGRVRVAFRTVRMAAREYIAAQNPADIDKADLEYKAASEEYLTALEMARKAYLGDKRDFDASLETFNAYRRQMDEMLAKIRAGDRAGAESIMHGRALEIAEENSKQNLDIFTFAEGKAASFMKASNQTRDDVVLTGILLLAISVLTGGLAAFVTARSVIRPVNAVRDCMETLTGGDLSVTVPGIERGDELGAMSRSVQIFKDNMIRVKRLEEQQFAEKQRAERERQAALAKMAESLGTQINGVVQGVTSAVSQLQSSARSMASSASDTSAKATSVATAAEEASSNVQTVASASEELAASINEISSQMSKSQSVADKAVEEARLTTVLMSKLAEDVERIGEIVNLINNIASQTNLLALNATIEAARAGAQGKGFAVVASEVKSLATQTGKATNEIGSKITAVQQGTQNAVKAIEAIASVIQDMTAISSTVAAAVQEQTSATGEIARNVDQAATGTRDVSMNIGGVMVAAGETGSAATQISQAAEELAQQAEVLKRQMANFMVQIQKSEGTRTLAEWDDSLSVGVPEIDQHHRETFDLVNTLFSQMMKGEGERAVSATVAKLGIGIMAHLREEEEVMARHAYPGLARHRQDHEAFGRRFEEIQRGGTNGQLTTIALLEFTADWVSKHIMQYDRALAEFTKARRVA